MEKRELISERILFGMVILAGYFGVGGIGAFLLRDNKEALAVTRDVLITVGPLLGVIVNSIWKADKVDKVTANTAAVLADKAPNLSGAVAIVSNPGDPNVTNPQAAQPDPPLAQ